MASDLSNTARLAHRKRSKPSGGKRRIHMVDFAKMLEERRRRHNIENDPTGIPGKRFTTQVKITPAGSDYAIKFGYDAALLAKLKASVPESERTWHKGEKIWLVSPDAIEMAIQAINS